MTDRQTTILDARAMDRTLRRMADEIVEPRSVGTFLIVRSLISLNGSAVSRTRRI